ncbi:hypothetical protein J7L13_01840 [bacterium]|nr:hypothetical protein [bacterium]
MVIKYYGLKVPTAIRTDSPLITDPDIYTDIVDAPDPIPLTVKFSFLNNEGLTLYVKAELISAPEGYSMEPLEVGEVAHGSKIDFEVLVNRDRPENTDFMEIEENITLRISVYTDSEYVALYDHVDITLTVHIINSAHSGWEIVKEINFDDGTTQDAEVVRDVIRTNGTVYYSHEIVNDQYVSPPYSLRFYAGTGSGSANSYDWFAGIQFSIDLSGKTKAYLIAYIRKSNDRVRETRIVIDGKEYYFNYPNSGEWFKVVVPLPPSSVSVKIQNRHSATGYQITSYAWFDNIKVIAV